MASSKPSSRRNSRLNKRVGQNHSTHRGAKLDADPSPSAPRGRLCVYCLQYGGELFRSFVYSVEEMHAHAYHRHRDWVMVGEDITYDSCCTECGQPFPRRVDMIRHLSTCEGYGY